MPKESVLTDRDKQSIEIVKFIFHIIVRDDFVPHYLDEVILTRDQVAFFKNRFVDASLGTQFLFTNKSELSCYQQCKAITENPDKSFLRATKALTASFQEHHLKTTSDGVFVTSLVKIRGKVPLLFLVKLDNNKVYEYTAENRKGILKEIQNTFVEDKKAVQKVAIIDVGDAFGWDVLAHDKKPGTGKILSDYFLNFLAVKQRHDNRYLTTTTIRLVYQWAVTNRELLSDSQEVASYKVRCIEYLRSVEKVKGSDLVDFVLSPEPADQKTVLRNSLRKHLQDEGVYGQAFAPVKSAIDRDQTKNVVRTFEGIKIEWDGKPEDKNLMIDKVADENGQYGIRIKTDQVIYTK